MEGFLNWVIVAVVVIVVLGYIIKIYNQLVKLRLNVERQASHVDVYLKKKFDLIPALVEVVKGYAKHEKGTIEEVTKLRSQWGESQSSDEKFRTANRLESTLSKLLVVQERYPNLKADKSLLVCKRA